MLEPQDCEEIMKILALEEDRLLVRYTRAMAKNCRLIESIQKIIQQ